MKLLDSVIIERPKDCDGCLFGGYDQDNGDMCMTYRRDSYTKIDKSGKCISENIQSPQEALEHECRCIFISKE